MRLADVDRQEVRPAFVLLRQVAYALDRAAERRSGIAAEDEDERAGADALGDPGPRRAIEAHEGDVGRAVADLELALLALVVADHPDYVAGTDVGDAESSHEENEGTQTDRELLPETHFREA
jgi:hypothetical protein